MCVLVCVYMCVSKVAKEAINNCRDECVFVCVYMCVSKVAKEAIDNMGWLILVAP